MAREKAERRGCGDFRRRQQDWSSAQSKERGHPGVGQRTVDAFSRRGLGDKRGKLKSRLLEAGDSGAAIQALVKRSAKVGTSATCRWVREQCVGFIRV